MKRVKEFIKNNKKIVIIVGCIIVALAIITTTLILLFNKKENIYLSNKEIYVALDDLYSLQQEADEEINSYIGEKEYTLNHPKVMVNPYTISPLSAVIIFTTNKEVSVDVYINDNKVSTYEESKNHVIDIYGLRNNYANKVTLKTSDGNENEVEIQTDDILYFLDVSKSNSVGQYGDYYFVTGPMGLGAGAFDGDGNCVWYISQMFTIDLEWLDNGHILLSNGESYGSDNGYTGFVEIDYLGKIYRKYILENSYHHEVNELSNGDLMVFGDNMLSDTNNDYIYIMDRNTGKEKSHLDLN